MICQKCNYEYNTIEQEIGGSVYIFPMSCPECDKAFRMKLEAETKANNEKAEAERINTWIKNAEIPPRYAVMREFTAKNQSQSLTWDFKKNLIFTGGTGAGKTTVACWLAIVSIIKYRKTARYKSYPDLLLSLDSNKFGKIVNTESVIQDCIECDILILDEIDKGVYSNYLFQIMNGRYNKQLPTIIIGNATIDEIKAIFGDALNSRLREQGAIVKGFASIDYRGIK